MTRVDFYILNHDTPTAVFQVITKLVMKIHQDNQTVFLLCQNRSQADALDDWLWTFDDASFLPHALVDALPDDERPPILIGALDVRESTKICLQHKILINLTDTLPEHIEAHERILEVVSPDAKTAARTRYKAYQAQHCELHRHFV